MRPIKFRGRAIDNGEFVFGDFGRAANTGEPIIYFIDDERNWVGATVDEDSVAQLVGYDANGKEVYEGDVVFNPGIMGYQDAQLINNYDDEHITLKEDEL